MIEPGDIERRPEPTLTRVEKFLTALTSFGLFCLGLLALLLLTLFVAGCGGNPTAASVPEEPLRVLVLASVPGTAWFCIEDPQMNGFFEEPQVRHGRIVCPLTVADLRRQIARLQVAD